MKVPPASDFSRRQILKAAGLASIAAAIPEILWAQTSQTSQWPAEAIDASRIRTLADIAGPEGPSLLPDGSIATVEYEAGIVIRIDADGKKETLATLGHAPVGTALGRDGMLYVVKLNPAQMAKAFASSGPPPGNMPAPEDSAAGVFRLDVKTRALKTLYTQYEGQPLGAPDDIVVDRWGDIWFTDTAARCVYWCRTDGSAIRRVIDNVPGVNGITMSPDFSTIYIVTGGVLTSFTVSSRGQLLQRNGQAAARAVMTWPKGMSPDGMRTEASGNLINGCLKDGIVVVSPDGKIVSQTTLPGLQPISLAFGGSDLKTLFVAAAGASRSEGKFVELPWPRAGMKLT